MKRSIKCDRRGLPAVRRGLIRIERRSFQSMLPESERARRLKAIMSPEITTRDTTKHVLFGLAAGYCQYRGCDKRNLGDPLTGEVFNTGWAAHVIGSKPGGPRGDDDLSKALRDDIKNLMLLCDVHHRLVDKKDPRGHPPEVLYAMKGEHEARIELACGIPPDARSHVLLYVRNIGDHKTALDYATTAPAP